MTKTEQFAEKVYQAVRKIPPGRVASYGMLAMLAGAGQCSRWAGRAMKHAPAGLPWHRVVNSAGRLVPGVEWLQRERLEAEGVTFRPNGYVDMKKHRWQPWEQPEENT